MKLVIDNDSQQQLSAPEEIFNYWKEIMNKPRARMNAKRKSVIQARLKEGYEWEDFKEAIDGCRKSSFHMGDNARNKPYNDIELICRDGVKLEGFAEQKTAQEAVAGRIFNSDWADGL